MSSPLAEEARRLAHLFKTAELTVKDDFRLLGILDIDIPKLAEENEELRRALDRIASNEAFGTAGTLGRGWADNECRQRMRLARQALRPRAEREG